MSGASQFAHHFSTLPLVNEAKVKFCTFPNF